MPVFDVDGLTFPYASGAAPAVRDLRFRNNPQLVFLDEPTVGLDPVSGVSSGTSSGS